MTEQENRAGPDRGFDPDRHIDAVAPAVGLVVTAAQRPGVVRFLNVAQAMAVQVFAVPIDPDEIDLAPTFRPGSTVARS